MYFIVVLPSKIKGSVNKKNYVSVFSW